MTDPHDVTHLKALVNEMLLDDERRRQMEYEAKREEREREHGPAPTRLWISALGGCLIKWGFGQQREIPRPEPTARSVDAFIRGRLFHQWFPRSVERALASNPKWRKTYDVENGDELIRSEVWVERDEPIPHGGKLDVAIRWRDGAPYDIWDLKDTASYYPEEPAARYQYQVGAYFNALDPKPQGALLIMHSPHYGYEPWIVDPSKAERYLEMLADMPPLTRILGRTEPPTIEEIGKLQGPTELWMCKWKTGQCEWLDVCMAHFGKKGGTAEAYSIPGARTEHHDRLITAKRVLDAAKAEHDEAKRLLAEANPQGESTETPLGITWRDGRGAWQVRPRGR